VGAFDERRAAQALRLTQQHRPVAILPIGKPAGTPPAPTPRQPLRSVVSYVG
jgi:nitroreductase